MWLIAAALAALLAGAPPPSFQVRRVPDLAYHTGGLDKHRLDLYLPVVASVPPLVIFVHGGAFLQGDRRDVQSVGEALARQGLAVAIPSYRLFPDTNAQGSTQDVADAAAWAMRHAPEYGYDARKVFLVGHSAGAQIVALLGTNPAYFQRAGASFASIGGVLAVAGAYDLRDLSGEPDSWQRVDGHIYGETPDARGLVSPSRHIDPHSPPTEVACGTEDDPGACPRALYFERALRGAGIDSRVIREAGADHIGMLRALTDPRDPLNQELHDFIARNSLSSGAAGVDAIAAYAGTWDVNVTHYQTKYSKPRTEHSTLRNDCWRSADYYSCDQIVDGQSRALLVFTYDSKQNVYHSYVIPQDGSGAHEGTLLINGSTWTYPMQDKDGERTVFVRIVNEWQNASTIQFRQEFSYDQKSWTLAASGIEHKTSP